MSRMKDHDIDRLNDEAEQMPTQQESLSETISTIALQIDRGFVFGKTDFHRTTDVENAKQIVTVSVTFVKPWKGHVN